MQSFSLVTSLVMCLSFFHHNVNAKQMSVAMIITKKDDASVCSDADTALLSDIPRLAMEKAGMKLSNGSKNKWKIFEEPNNNGNNGNHNGAGNGNGNGNGHGDPDLDDRRRRQLCGGQCYTMCQTTGLPGWCNCCPCCGGSRRLRVEVDASRELTTANVIEAAENSAEEMLEEMGPIDCLQYPLDVTVVVEE